MSFKHDSDCGRNVCQRFVNLAEKLTAVRWTKMKKFEDFEEWLHRPVDSASLGVCRMLFGKEYLFLALGYC